MESPKCCLPHMTSSFLPWAPLQKRREDGLSSTESDEQAPSPPSRFAKYYICDSELLEKILEPLSFSDLLSARLVCHNWYKIIGDLGLQWRRTRMALTKARLSSSEFGGYANTDLVKRFHCPNFSFYGADLREDLFRNFFVIHGLQLKHIVIHNCFISKSTFDLVLLQCPNLEHFEITCVSRIVSLCEVLFPRGLCMGFSMSKLSVLILKRLDSYTREDVAGGEWQNFIPAKAPLDPMDENLDGENLSASFLEQLLETCVNLKEINLGGWAGPTVYNLVSLINSRPQFITLKRLRLGEIIGSIDESFFFPLCTKTDHLRLKELWISLKLPVALEDHKRRLDSVLELILEAQRESLQALSLVNMPITTNVFRNVFASLISLRLLNTWVHDVDPLIVRMPKLDTIDFHPMERRLGKNKSRYGHCFAQFCQCSMIDLVCLVTFLVVMCLIVLIALVFQFEIYGQWFFVIGFVILAAICLADFLQHYPTPDEE